jgi:hypothetical protein
VPPREILQNQIADALASSRELCIAASARLNAADDYIDQSREAVARSRAILTRASAGTRLG